MNTTAVIVLVVFLGGIAFAILKSRKNKAAGSAGGRKGSGKNKV